jgi:hypothetical protein
MRATNALLSGLGVLALVACVYLGTCWFVRAARVGPVKGWIRNAKGFGPAKSPDDALDKFKLAVEKRDYDAAAQYVGGDYREWFEKGADDAEALADEIANLEAAMRKHGVKSARGDFVLYLLQPFPTGYKYKVGKSEADAVTATLHWDDVIAPHVKNGQTLDGLQGWRVDRHAYHSLLPDVVLDARPLQVTVKKETGGHWRIYFPTQGGTDRHVRDTVDYLRKNGTNYRNALKGLKNDVKNEPQTKENFENALRTKLEQSQ